MKYLLALFVTMICYAKDPVKHLEKAQSARKDMSTSMEAVFDDFALLQDVNLRQSKSGRLYSEISIPFIWPVHAKSIKKITFYAPNSITFELKKSCDVLNPHKGIVISVHDKVIVVKHIIEGGTCYISILKNIDNIRVKEGDIIPSGAILGKSEVVVFELKQLDIQIRPSLDMLFPPLDPKLIRVVKRFNDNKPESVEVLNPNAAKKH